MNSWLTNRFSLYISLYYCFNSFSSTDPKKHMCNSVDPDETACKKPSHQNLQFAILFFITKTRLYNFDPLKSHFHMVKLGFTGVYIIFLIFLKNKDCGYSLEPPRQGGSNEYLQSMYI